MAIRFCKGKSELGNEILSVRIGRNLFRDLHNLFLETKSEYLAVCDEQDNILCYAYDDTELDSIVSKIVIMSNSQKGIQFFRDIGEVTIVSFNEIAFYLFLTFRKAGCKIHLIGELWDMVFDEEDIVSEVIGFGFYCEGNLGLKLEDLGFWRNAFPYSEIEVIEDEYSKLKKNHGLYNKKWIDKSEANRRIIEKISSGVPLMTARFGNTEAAICIEYLKGYYSEKWLKWLYSTSGFFSQDKILISDVDRYVNLTLEALKSCDFNCCRFEREAGLINVFGDLDIYSNIDWYDLYSDFDEKNVWLSALEGKKVLIVSSAADTICYQYNKKEQLFNGANILPNMELIKYIPPQTQLGNTQNFKDWFESFDKMCEAIRSIDFDIALISAGAYGYPLAAEIKRMGKQAIELCSGIYPIFGIKVKTQAIIRKVSSMYNSHWIFPIEKKPNNYMQIEKGSYWE